MNQSAAPPAASTATASPAVSGVIRSRTVREAVAGRWGSVMFRWVPVMLLYGPGGAPGSADGMGGTTGAAQGGGGGGGV